MRNPRTTYSAVAGSVAIVLIYAVEQVTGAPVPALVKDSIFMLTIVAVGHSARDARRRAQDAEDA